MKRIIWLLVLATLGWYAYGKYEAYIRSQRAADAAGQRSKPIPAASSRTDSQGPSFFTCDGRNSCSQMTSCEEAKFFLKNCPLITEGNRETAACDKQWCK